jgi:RNA polymerase sigma-70 factor (ECF subfamily)
MTPAELTLAFEQCRNPLKAFLLRITASPEDAGDLVQDTYIRAQTYLESFRGESSIKTWLFAIAANLARDHLRARKRWPENVTDICREQALSEPEYFAEVQHLQQTSPQAAFEIREHITFCLTCISRSLPLEQQIALLLKEVHDFKVKEIAEIMAVSEAMVKYYLHTSRSKMVDIFEGRCALINQQGICHQCSELNGIFNPQQQFEEERNKIEFARRANDPDRQRLLDLRLQIVRETDPFHSAGSALQLHHLRFNRDVMGKKSEKTTT